MNKMKNPKYLNLLAGILSVLLIAVLIAGVLRGPDSLHVDVSDGISQIDLDTIYLKSSGVEVNFSEIILSGHNETRKLIVGTQEATVSTELTDRMIKQLDFDFLKKTQTVSYTGTGYFVVDLDTLTAANIIQDKKNRTVTLKIDHAYLQAVDINPNNIIIDEVREGLLARGDIELTVADYNTIEKELRTRLEQKFDTAANGQAADDLALKMVKEVYEPIVKAIDRRYSVIVEFA
ncbi:MAG: DUF4230 domain-containing protein [Ruminococcaceae bacterium]|nr:DUF4230 domain-containing protein [Oscillospiraceae bacterium]